MSKTFIAVERADNGEMKWVIEVTGKSATYISALSLDILNTLNRELYTVNTLETED